MHMEPLVRMTLTLNPHASPAAAQLIRALMDAALAAGLNTLRMWSHGVTSTFSSQPSPGAFAEPMFRGLDYALEQARLRNIKARPACPLYTYKRTACGWTLKSLGAHVRDVVLVLHHVPDILSPEAAETPRVPFLYK